MILKTRSLTEIILRVVAAKGTEAPFSGEYDNFDRAGTYLCRQCGLALFRSQSKFHSGCGWPSFDEEVAGAVIRRPDVDGRRTEIMCVRCGAHLGHEFKGEGFTEKNTRHCVNSLSLDFITDLSVTDTEEAILAGGCFWGVEFLFKKLPGVLKTEVGYSGGASKSPTYAEVCTGTTGHYEAMRVMYDPQKLSYRNVLKFFFEVHDPTQVNGQGPDIGQQYQSVIFYFDEEQKKIAQQLMHQLSQLGYQLATQLLPVTTFWRAEEYHQDYYQKQGKQPYCHFYNKKFD